MKVGRNKKNIKKNSFSSGAGNFARQEKDTREDSAAASGNAPAAESGNDYKKNYAMWVSVLDSMSQADSLNAQIQATENHVKDLNGIKEKLENQVKDLNGNKTQLGNRINELADYNAKLEKEIHTLYDYNAKLEKEIHTLYDYNAKLEKELHSLYDYTPKLEKQIHELTDQKAGLENQVTSLSARLERICRSASYRIGRFIWPFGSADK